jgi:hypothetical protein
VDNALAELGCIFVQNTQQIIQKPFGIDGLNKLDLVRNLDGFVGGGYTLVANIVGQNKLLVYSENESEELLCRVNKISYGRKIESTTNYRQFRNRVAKQSVTVIAFTNDRIWPPSTLDVNTKVKTTESGRKIYETLICPPDRSKVGGSVGWLKKNNLGARAIFVDNQAIHLKPQSDRITKVGILNTQLISHLSNQNYPEVENWIDNDNNIRDLASRGEIILYGSHQDFIDNISDLRKKID